MGKSNEGKHTKDRRHQGRETQDTKLNSYEFRKTFQIPIRVWKPQSVTWKDQGRQAAVSRAQTQWRVTKQTEGGNEGIPLLIWGSLAGRAKPMMTGVEWMALTEPESQSQGLCSQKKKGNTTTLLIGCLSFKNKSRIPLSHAHFYTVFALF